MSILDFIKNILAKKQVVVEKKVRPEKPSWRKSLDHMLDDVWKHDYCIVGRIKKPHKFFDKGDIVAGIITDGQGERLLCWGWSTKQNRMINRYSIRYGNWRDMNKKSGHLEKETKTYNFKEEKSFWKVLESCRSQEEYLRELSELCGSNFPIG